jgi:hypothetical protein
MNTGLDPISEVSRDNPLITRSNNGAEFDIHEEFSSLDSMLNGFVDFPYDFC